MPNEPGSRMTKKIALVTGASAGIGRNAVISLSAVGFTVIATARNMDGLKQTAALSDGDVVCIASDVTEVASVDTLFDSIKEKFGRLDVLFNNAGNMIPGTNFGDMEFEQFKSVIDVNLTEGGRAFDIGPVVSYETDYLAKLHAYNHKRSGRSEVEFNLMNACFLIGRTRIAVCFISLLNVLLTALRQSIIKLPDVALNVEGESKSKLRKLVKQLAPPQGAYTKTQLFKGLEANGKCKGFGSQQLTADYVF
ncbi:putative oxidoreductase [Nymphon striatum]|nr:putative oxidoreductase [Nymphon striatum]